VTTRHVYIDETKERGYVLVASALSRVRVLSGRLLANPFDTPAAEALLDVLLDQAPVADLALARVLTEVVCGPLSGGSEILAVLAGDAAVRPAHIGAVAA